MALHRKPYIENRQKIAEQKLSHRLAALKAQGLEDIDIQKDATIRQIKAAIRHAKRQMAWIADLEAKDLKKAVAREEKRNAPKAARPKVKKALQGESHRKAKRDKKQSM
jgi:tRNA A37 N6-isopentenylltransferase MiaA